MNINGQVGPVASSASLASGQNPILRLGNMGDLIVSELHGRYYEAAYRKTLMAGANSTGVAISTAATTYTGLLLANPSGSQVNLVLTKVALCNVVAQTTVAAVGLGRGSGTLSGTTVDLVSNRTTGGVTPTGLIYKAATISVAPTVDSWLFQLGTGATTVQEASVAAQDQEGGIVVVPGSYVCLVSTVALVAASTLNSFVWEEVPL